jgi:hypothetical protein
VSETTERKPRRRGRSWQPIETAPRDGTELDGKLANGTERPIKWAAGGGWAGRWGPGFRGGPSAWLMFNEEHQPVAWRYHRQGRELRRQSVDLSKLKGSYPPIE